MGLDISVNLDNQNELYELKEFENLLGQSNLSRTFCNFMCRREAVSDESELDQLGDITGVDIRFLYEMEEYFEEWEIDEMLEFEEDEEEKFAQKESILNQNEKVYNNLYRVRDNLVQLIEKLNEIPDLVERLNKPTEDTLGIDEYFSAFQYNTGDGYIGNNLGQDLRNLLKIVEFGLENGSKTIYFNYG